MMMSFVAVLVGVVLIVMGREAEDRRVTTLGVVIVLMGMAAAAGALESQLAALA